MLFFFVSSLPCSVEYWPSSMLALSASRARLLLPLPAVRVWGSHDKVISPSPLPGSLCKSLLLSDFTPFSSLGLHTQHVPSPVTHRSASELLTFLFSATEAIFGYVMQPSDPTFKCQWPNTKTKLQQQSYTFLHFLPNKWIRQ